MAYIGENQNSTRMMTLALSGAVAVFAVILLTGCRFGNSVEKAEPPKNPDNLTGYYETAPKKVTYCISTTEGVTGLEETSDGTTPAPGCVETTTDRVPTLIAQVMGNPVAFIVDEWKDRTANIVDPYNPDQVALPVSFDKDTLELNYFGATEPDVLWKYRGCETAMSLNETGKIIQGSGPFTSGFTEAELFGRIQMTVQVMLSVDGQCDQSLTEMHACYMDADDCGGEDVVENNAYQAAVQSYYQDFIDAGAMTADQIPTVRGLSYEIQYE